MKCSPIVVKLVPRLIGAREISNSKSDYTTCHFETDTNLADALLRSAAELPHLPFGQQIRE